MASTRAEITRGMRKAFLWRRVLWIRSAPGRAGLGAVVLGPSLFFLPLETVPLFPDRLHGVAVLLWFFSLALALGVRGGGHLRDQASIWLFQKGCGSGELALEDWILDLGLFLLASAWWGLMGAVAVGGGWALGFSHGVAFLLLGLATAGITHALTLCLSAGGVERPSDPTVLLALLSLLAPVLAARAPGWVGTLAGFALPPFRAAVELHGYVRIGAMGEAAGSLAHVVLFTGIALGIGLWRISLWRPSA